MRPSLMLIFLMINPVLAVAQRARAGIPGPVPSQVLWSASQGPLRQPLALGTVRREIGPTHWKEGAAIGGAAMGLGIVLLVEAAGCEDCDVFPAWFLMGAVPGSIIGALIGGMFPKDE